MSIRVNPWLPAWSWRWLAVFLMAVGACAAEVIPPAPRDYFNDYAGVVARPVAEQLNAELIQFERDTSNQIVVAIFPHLQSDSSIEDYTVRVAQAWKVGQADQRNGAVLFVFTQDRKLFIQVGYGLEGVLPDARCKQIVENEIKPRFRNGDYSGGVAAGMHAMLASVRGEYRGSGRTVREARGGQGGGVGGLFIGLVFMVIVVSAIFRGRRNTLYQSRGRRGIWVTPPWGGGGGGGNWGGGGGGGGGSFSGGGGSFGGGGAGGSW